MAFQLKVKERCATESRAMCAARSRRRSSIWRNSRAAARGQPVTGKRKPARPEWRRRENEGVHEVRKCFKRVRAALRLVREDLGDDFYREENWSLRDAARPLNLVRDADVLVQTADRLAQQFPEAVEPGAFAKIHAALVKNQEGGNPPRTCPQKAAALAKEAATRALKQLPDWKITRDGWAALESGLRRVYRRPSRARVRPRAQAWKICTRSASRRSIFGINFSLWRQMDGAGKELIDQTHRLSTLLGEDHDLAVLRQTLAADPLAYGGHRVLKAVFAVSIAAAKNLNGRPRWGFGDLQRFARGLRRRVGRL